MGKLQTQPTIKDRPGSQFLVFSWIVCALESALIERIMYADEDRWSLPVALAWIIWRDSEALLDVHPLALSASSRMARCAAAPSMEDVVNMAIHSDRPTVLPAPEAMAVFWRQLIECKLPAIGVRQHDKAELFLSADDWLQLTPLNPHPVIKHHALIDNATGETRFTNVRIRRADALASWPATRKGVVYDEKIALEERLTEKLIGIFRLSPNEAIYSKNQLIALCSEFKPFPSDLFDRAKKAAVLRAQTPAWSRAGRKPKRIAGSEE